MGELFLNSELCQMKSLIVKGFLFSLKWGILSVEEGWALEFNIALNRERQVKASNWSPF